MKEVERREFRMGLDLGGTKIEGLVMDDNGREIARKRIATEQEGGYAHILQRIDALHRELAQSIDFQAHTLGIGTPGAISHRTGLLKNSNTVCMNGKPLKSDLEALLGRRVAIQNDANCFAMAEARFGAGKGQALVFGVILGTGCGGGIVHHGEALAGPQSIAGEWGHMSIDPNGPLCYCGQRGCVETYISGGGLENRWFEQYSERCAFPEIVSRAQCGCPHAMAFMARFYDHFGRSLANLINILDPDMVVLGGGVSNVEALYLEGVEQVRKYIFSDSLETPIVKHQIGDSAGVLGAALVGL